MLENYDNGNIFNDQYNEAVERADELLTQLIELNMKQQESEAATEVITEIPVEVIAPECVEDDSFIEQFVDMLENQFEALYDVIQEKVEDVAEVVNDCLDGDNNTVETETFETESGKEFVEPEYGWTSMDFRNKEEVDEAMDFYYNEWNKAIENDDVAEIEKCKRNIEQLSDIRSDFAYQENLAFQAKLDRDLETYKQNLKLFEVDPPKY